MSRATTIAVSSAALALGATMVAGCGKDANVGDSSASRTTTTTATTPRKSIKPARKTSTTPTSTGKTTTGKTTTSTTPEKSPKPTKSAKRPKSSVLERATLVVVMKQNMFTPAKLNGKVGQQITWVNNDTRIHNVTATSGAGFKSGDVKARGTFVYKPKAVGRIDYVCTIHAGQRGTINVVG